MLGLRHWSLSRTIHGSKPPTAAGRIKNAINARGKSMFLWLYYRFSGVTTSYGDSNFLTVPDFPTISLSHSRWWRLQYEIPDSIGGSCGRNAALSDHRPNGDACGHASFADQRRGI